MDVPIHHVQLEVQVLVHIPAHVHAQDLIHVVAGLAHVHALLMLEVQVEIIVITTLDLHHLIIITDALLLHLAVDIGQDLHLLLLLLDVAADLSIKIAEFMSVICLLK